MAAGGARRRPVDGGQTPQQRGGDDGNGSDRLDVHTDGQADGRPAEAEHCSVSLPGAGDVTSDLHQLRQIRGLSAAHALL